MEWHRFSPGQEPRVLTATSEQCSDGECWKCPGIFHLEEYGNESIFCIHPCHQVQNQDGASPRIGPELFFVHLDTWYSRECQITLAGKDGKVMEQFNAEVGECAPASSTATFLRAGQKVALDFAGAQSFKYVDYNDPEMAKDFEAGFAARMEVRLRNGVAVLLLLKRDLFFPGDPEYEE